MVDRKIEKVSSELDSSGPEEASLLDSAGRLDDLRVPPGNRLEALKAERAGQFSIRINDQFLAVFRLEKTATPLTSRSRTIINCNCRGGISAHVVVKRNAVPSWKIHPGEILREEFLKPMNLSANELARSLHVPAPRINDIILSVAVSPQIPPVRLARFFQLARGILMNLQLQYEVRAARQRLRRTIRKIQHRVAQNKRRSLSSHANPQPRPRANRHPRRE